MFVITRIEQKTGIKEYWDGGMFKTSEFRARLYPTEDAAISDRGMLGALLGYKIGPASPEVIR